MREYVEPLWGWDEEEQERIFDEKFAPERWQVIQVGSTDIGVLDVQERPGEVVLANIALLPGWQSRGIGGALLDALLARASADGRALTLRVVTTNQRAKALYERKGLRVVRETAEHFYLRADPPALRPSEPQS